MILDTAECPNASADTSNFRLPTVMDEDHNPYYEVKPGSHRVPMADIERYLLGQSMFSTSAREQARAALDPYVRGDLESSDSWVDSGDWLPYGPNGSGEDCMEWNQTGTLSAPKLEKRYRREQLIKGNNQEIRRNSKYGRNRRNNKTRGRHWR